MNINASRHDGAPLTPRLAPAQKQVIDRLVRMYHTEMVFIAKHLLWQYHIDGLGVDPEGAVNGALIKLCQALAADTIQEIDTRDDFLKAFRTMLKRFIQDERKRQDAREARQLADG